MAPLKCPDCGASVDEEKCVVVLRRIQVGSRFAKVLRHRGCRVPRKDQTPWAVSLGSKDERRKS